MCPVVSPDRRGGACPPRRRRSASSLLTAGRAVWSVATAVGLVAGGGAAAAVATGRSARPDGAPPGPGLPGPWTRPGGARRLAEATAAVQPANAGPAVAGWSALLEGEVDVPPPRLAALQAQWQPREALLYPGLFAGTPGLTWGSVNRTLFGPDALALRGGARGAAQVSALGSGDGVGAACATFAARHPELLAQRLQQNGSQITVHLSVKTLPEAGGFADLPVTLDATLPVAGATQALAASNPNVNATWSLYVAKALATFSAQEGLGDNLLTFDHALQALLGQEVQAVNLARSGDADYASASLRLAVLLDGLPSVSFDAWMQRLGERRLGGLTFRDGLRLAGLPAYDAASGIAIFADGNVSAVLRGGGVRVRGAALDVILLGGRTYGVVDVTMADARARPGLPRPVDVTLTAGTGQGLDPQEAAAWGGGVDDFLANATRRPDALTLPLTWVKRLANGGTFA